MFIIPLYTICLYSALYFFSRFVFPLARVYNFIYRNILKKSNINFFNPIFWCFRRAQKKLEVWGTSSVSQQYPKQSGKLQCTSSMFHTIKHLTFPKRKGNGQLTTWFSLCIFFLKPNEMLGGRGLSWRTGVCHIFIKVTTHKEFLYTHPQTLMMLNASEDLALLCWLRQLGNSRIQPEPLSDITLWTIQETCIKYEVRKE